eukprot:6492285-Amphidinium_carterae.1
MEAIQLIDFKVPQYLQWFEIEESMTPVPSLSPNLFALRPIGESIKYWPKQPRQASLSTHVGWDVLLAQRYAELEAPIEAEPLETEELGSESEVEDELLT